MQWVFRCQSVPILHTISHTTITLLALIIFNMNMNSITIMYKKVFCITFQHSLKLMCSVMSVCVCVCVCVCLVVWFFVISFCSFYAFSSVLYCFRFLFQTFFHAFNRYRSTLYVCGLSSFCLFVFVCVLIFSIKFLCLQYQRNNPTCSFFYYHSLSFLVFSRSHSV